MCRVTQAPQTRCFIQGKCPECGNSFTHKAHPRAKGFCSRRCQQKVKQRRRKARKRGVGSKTLTFHTVAERDGFRCGLCGEPVDMSLSVPHLRAPTLDHIVPLARGGSHSLENVHLAHFLCNSIKGDGTHNARSQLALA